MDRETKSGFRVLATTSMAVITASLGLLSNKETHASPQNPNTDLKKSDTKMSPKKMVRPKLVLKLNTANPENSKLIAQHRSHSSHSSHSSHRSHSSHYSSSSYSGGSDNSVGWGTGAIIVGGLVALGAYQLGKHKSKK